MAGGKTSSQSPLREADFEAIEAAVMETARGRWFLAEFVLRHRAADTAAVLEALARLEAKLGAPQAAPASPREAPPLPQLDLSAVAAHLLRGNSVGWSEPEPAAETPGATIEADADDPWPPEDVGALALQSRPPLIVAPLEESESEPPDDNPDLADEDIAVWEAELTAFDPPPVERRSEMAPRIRPGPQIPPPAAIAAPASATRPAAIARPALPPFPPARPAPRVMVAAPAATAQIASIAVTVTKPVAPVQPPAPRPAVASSAPPPPRQERLQPKPGRRIDDPTLTMTRDEKLALFS